MFSTDKTYTRKGSATRAINKAVADGEFSATELETRKVEGGFQVFLIQEAGPAEYCDEELEARMKEFNALGFDGTETPSDWFIFPQGTAVSEIKGWFDNEYSDGLAALLDKTNPVEDRKADALPDHQKLALSALAAVKPLAGKPGEERAGVWFPFAAIYESENPCNLAKRSMGGIMRGLTRRGLILIGKGGEGFGKSVVTVCVTRDGLAAVQA